MTSFRIRQILIPLICAAALLPPAAHSTPKAPKSAKQAALDAAFLAASESGDLAKMQQALDEGANVDTRNAIGQTVLERQAYYGKADTVQFLLDHHADINAHSVYGDPLSEAAGRAYLPIVKLLLDHGANPNGAQNDGGPLAAVMNDTEDADALEMLTLNPRLHASISTVISVSPSGTADGEQPMRRPTPKELADARKLQEKFEHDEAVRTQQWARQQLKKNTDDRIAILNMLLDHGADPHKHQEGSGTALTSAAQSNIAEGARILLEHGCDPNLRDRDGRTALMAANGPDTAVAQLLLAHGAKIDARDKNGASALILTALAQHSQVPAFLVEQGADVNVRDVFGDTPLLMAALNGDAALVRLMLDHGANPHVRNRRGETPLSYARMRHDKAMIALIKAALRRPATPTSNPKRKAKPS